MSVSVSNRIKTLVNDAKATFTQYYNGSKIIRSQAQEAHQLIQKQKSGYQLNRAETRLILKSRNDVRKLWPFFAVLLILPEVIPLIIIYRPAFIPFACWSPKQIVF